MHQKKAGKRRSQRLRLERLEDRRVMANTPLITEFLASNQSGLADGNGQSSDWIELYNPTAQAINLAGWRLTDDAQSLSKWTFPALPQSVLDPGEHLVVFASGQLNPAYVDPSGHLHTTFSLAQEGEYLALVNPSGQIVQAYAPQFPAQRRDVSYGVLQNISTVNLVGDGSTARALVPSSGALDSSSTATPPAWTLPSFDDSGWTASVGGPGVGYDSGDDPIAIVPEGVILPEGLIGGDLTDPEEDGALNGTWFAGGFPGSPTGEEPPMALDNTVTTKWLAFQPSGTYYWFRFANGERYNVNAYTISSANDEPNRDPYSWTLSGSNDGVNYTVVDSRTAQEFGSRFLTRLYEFNNSTAYEYYRFDFQTRFGATGENQPVAIQMAEIELFSAGGVDFQPAINLNVGADWSATPTSVYQRIEFDVANPASLASLQLQMQYDDGFVAYLNGSRVAAAKAPTLPNFNSSASGERPDVVSLEAESFNLTPFLAQLVAGTNVLAIHALNASDGSPDLLSRPRLVATQLIDETLTPAFMAPPTPGAANAPGYEGLVAEPLFSAERGFYSAPFQLNLSTTTPGSQIYYTTNGLPPTPANGTLYAAPIPVSGTSTIRAQAYRNGYLESPPETHTYLFVNDVVRQNYQATLNRGFPTAWGSTSPDYGMDPDVIGNFNAAGNPIGGDRYGGQYAATIKNDLLALPTLSIVMNTSDMFGSRGIYTNSTAGGDAWERPTSVELIYPNGDPGFQIDAGIRTQGGAFRSHGLTKKHSLRLLFKGEYQGNTKLDFPWFGDDAVTSFDTITLRADANDGYAWSSAGSRPQYARDEFGRRTQLALGQHAAHGARVHLYINGVYWGIYNPVERPDASFSATYYGGDKDEWDVINSGAATDGTMAPWSTLLSLSFGVSTASTEAARTAAYLRVLGRNPDGTDNPAWESYLDPANYSDYMLVNFFGANVDWPHRNWYAGRRRGADSDGFKFHIWDYETSLGLTTDVNHNNLSVGDGAATPFARLKSSQEFRLLFADRVHRAMFNGGPLTAASAVARYQQIIQELPQAIVAESARWGDQHRSTPYTKADWQAAQSTVINFLNARPNILLQQLRNAGLYPTTVAPLFSKFGGQVAPGFNLTMSAPAGTVWYTLDGSDPRLMGGGLNPAAIQYSGAVALQQSGPVKARALSGGSWSALTEAQFTTDFPLRITELHYNPAEHPGVADRQNLEFIELLNTGAAAISLDGVQIAGFAIEPYVFSNGLTLDAGQRIVVARDRAVFQTVYGPNINLAPTDYTDRNLSNGGELVTLLGPQGQTLQSFTYSDLAPWPSSPDATGPSLEMINPLGDPADPANWRASLTYGGSPDRSGATPASPGDYDNDGLVQSVDLARWRTNFGRAPGANLLLGDGDADQDVDGNDFLVWQRNFGATSLAVVAGSASLVAAGAAEPSGQPFDGKLAAVDAALAGLAQRYIGQLDRQPGDGRARRELFRPEMAALNSRRAPAVSAATADSADHASVGRAGESLTTASAEGAGDAASLADVALAGLAGEELPKLA